MNKNDLIEFLPRIHNLSKKGAEKQKGYTRYQICKLMSMGPSKGDYDKISELVDMGFLRQVNVNPPEFLPDRDKIWKFWKETPTGSECKRMIEDHTVVLE